jgi:hypothetical protein
VALVAADAAPPAGPETAGSVSSTSAADAPVVTSPDREPLSTPLREALQFLDAIFALATPGKIAIATAENGRWRKAKQFSDTFGAASAALDLASKGLDVYICVGRNTVPGHTAAGVYQLTFAWAEVDCPNDLPEERTAALAKLGEFYPPPSIIIASASGFHCYWLLDQATAPGTVRHLNIALCKALGSDKHMHPGADADLRLPGTLGYNSHTRRYDPPRRISIVSLAADRRYAARELAEALDITLDSARDASGTGPRYVSFARLLEAAETHLQVVSHGGDGRLRCHCPFHDDEHPSAVVFTNGWFFCSACGVNEPAARWTRRAAVRAWAESVVPRRGHVLYGLPVGYLRLPRVGLRNATALLAPHPDIAGITKRRDGWGRWSLTGDGVTLEALHVLGPRLRDELGPFALKVWFACVALAQGPAARVAPTERLMLLPRARDHVGRTADGAFLIAMECGDVRHGRPRPDLERGRGFDLLRVVGAGPQFERFGRDGQPVRGPVVRRDGVWSGNHGSWIAPYAVVPRTDQNARQLSPPLSTGVSYEDVRYDSEARVMFAVTINGLARLLGYRDGPDGHPQRKVRQAIRKALDGLQRTWLTFKLSGKTKHYFDGPLLWAYGRRRNGALVFVLHPGVRRQLMTGPAWSPWSHAALELHDDATLTLYLHVVREMWERGRTELVLPLELIARRSGMWNATRRAKNPGDYVATWRRRVKDLDQRGLLRVQLELGQDGRPMLHARPPRALRTAIEARAVGVARHGREGGDDDKCGGG